MKWRINHKLLITLTLATLIALLILESHSFTAQTHRLDTSVYHFKLDNDSRIKFDADTIYLGDSNGLWSWIDDDGVRFYNLKMADSECPTNWYMKVSGPANVTVTKLFEDNEFEATVTASSGITSTTEIYVGGRGKPDKVFIGNNQYKEGDFWTYSDQAVTVTWTHSSSEKMKMTWKGGALGLFNLHIHVTKDGLPTHATLNIEGENHTLFGLATYQLPYGRYKVTCYCDSKHKTKMVGLFADTTVCFNFRTPKGIKWREATLLSLPLITMHAK